MRHISKKKIMTSKQRGSEIKGLLISKCAEDIMEKKKKNIYIYIYIYIYIIQN